MLVGNLPPNPHPDPQNSGSLGRWAIVYVQAQRSKVSELLNF